MKNIQKHNQIILASNSPRRKFLLKGLGIKFCLMNPDIKENLIIDKTPIRLARKLAYLKAETIQKKLIQKSTVIIAADTIVVLGNHILGKPESKSDAVKMLTRLSGKTHRVITGICVMRGTKKIIRHEITKVSFRNLSKQQILNYVDTGEPMDKAGAYAIQGIGSILVWKIDGDYFNVVGLPLVKLSDMLKEFGIELI